MENLARYIMRTSFYEERMTYVPEESKVIYQSNNGKEEGPFLDSQEQFSYIPFHKNRLLITRITSQIERHGLTSPPGVAATC
jgi:hypothetical protein